MKVSNGSCIRRLSVRALLANRTRNIVAVLAIALTAVLFTSLFTIALSINEGIQQNNFRQAGGCSHGSFKYLTEEQCEELKTDPLIQAYGIRRFLGMPTAAPFNKSHVEIGYSDANEARWGYCVPVEGRLPQEGTNEAATDTHVLELLGVEPEIGAEFTVTFEVDGRETTQTFTLCGWWEYDEAVVANHILIPESRLNTVLAEVGVTPPGSDSMTGSWNLDVMLRHGARSIAADMEGILANHGYQSETAGENYISIGVNWGYTGAQLSDKLDPTVVAIIVGMLALILFTGYLIIYNVFQISVAGDIRFYGQLKTIGTTPRQLRRIILIQALLLSSVGIPVGLLLGWFLGGVLTPVITARLDGVTTVVSVSPLLFVGAAVFALATVLISCRRPGRLAGKVSPVEALRYTEGKALHRKEKRNRKGVSLLSMAWANLGRSRGKTSLTVLSLTLAVVLLTFTVTFAGGFDMDKYVSNFTASDFILADAGQFQTGGEVFNDEMGVPAEVIDAVNAQGGITDSGRVYGKTAPAQEFVTEEYYRSMWSRWNTPEQLDSMVAFMDRTADGLLADGVQLYGMEPFALDHLTVLEGDLSQLNDPEGNYIAAVYSTDDYGDPVMGSHWARLGDTVTIRYVEEFEYYDPATGEVYGSRENVPENAVYAERAVKYREVKYTVAALVSVPSALSYRYYGRDEFVLGAETFIRDTGTDSVMYYAFDTTKASNAAMEAFLKDYTENVNPQFDYESKAIYAAEFESIRSMFLLLGGALSFIVGLVGVLNFFNAILTGITARRRELAVLQSIGMTTRQLRAMLALEGLLYTLGSALLALVLVLVTTPIVGPGLNGMFWFFAYHFTLWPIAVVLPLFAVLGIGIPVVTCRITQRYSVVERLRVE
ncbi:MAG TPA: ABC transporter permease [Candidatus Gemmiger excrementigallinarum]|uniref:ABC transporter permease n=1 Tax=Candidatus Gemmiger excrementigallinarum TaxID=2838609 RepID=A0A9D2J9F0_9FIRM|nr:ABC transporter permease [Candidatus Gemmiger excrementigallinarum]